MHTWNFQLLSLQLSSAEGPNSREIDLENVKILDREPRWFEKGVKETTHNAIRINQPTNSQQRQGPIQVTKCYDPVLTSLPKASNSLELGHSADNSCSDESNWKFHVCKFIVLWSKVKSIHLNLLPTQMNFHSNKVLGMLTVHRYFKAACMHLHLFLTWLVVKPLYHTQICFSPLWEKRKLCFTGPTDPDFPLWNIFFFSLLKSCKISHFFGQYKIRHKPTTYLMCLLLKSFSLYLSSCILSMACMAFLSSSWIISQGGIVHLRHKPTSCVCCWSLSVSIFVAVLSMACIAFLCSSSDFWDASNVLDNSLIWSYKKRTEYTITTRLIDELLTTIQNLTASGLSSKQECAQTYHSVQSIIKLGLNRFMFLSTNTISDFEFTYQSISDSDPIWYNQSV